MTASAALKATLGRMSNANLSAQARLRIGWAEGAIFALQNCDPEKRAAICAAFLEAAETGGPVHDVFGQVYSDARFWADAAPVHELIAYTLAGLRRLPGAHLSAPARKRTFVALWDKFETSDSLAFLRRVDAEGRFQWEPA